MYPRHRAFVEDVGQYCARLGMLGALPNSLYCHFSENVRRRAHAELRGLRRGRKDVHAAFRQLYGCKSTAAGLTRRLCDCEI